MNIAYYHEEGILANNDFRQVDVEGNPGVGGTTYAFILIATLLSKSKKFVNQDVIFYHTGNAILPDSVLSINVNDMEDAFCDAERKKIDIMIIRSIYNNKELEIINKTNMKVIAWPSNFVLEEELKNYLQCSNLKKVVWVGRQHYDYYIDHLINSKSYYIYYPYVYRPREVSCANGERLKNNYVTYMGSLIPEKGFLLVAKMWKSIIREVPDAQLHVIGTGQLYNKNAVLGKWGVAEASFENEFMPYLLDDQGKLMESVIFEGLLGESRMELFLNSKVGIVNPAATTETFCLSAVEMESMGIPVVTSNHLGLLDTVKHGVCGLTSGSIKKMTKDIVRLLKDDELNEKLGGTAKQYVEQKFNVEKICEKWIELLESVYHDENIRIPNELQYDHIWKDYKWLRIINKNFKEVLGLKRWPSIQEWHVRLCNLKHKFSRGYGK